MGRVILYIAASLDGFIARPDDDISWLDEYMVDGEDYGYAKFIAKIGTAIMGARTYEQALLHPERLLKEIKTYVMTGRPLPEPPGAREGDVELFDGEAAELVELIREEDDRDIWLVGGGQIVAAFLNADLVDDIRLFVAPLMLGEGIPLFSMETVEIRMKLLEAAPYATGIVKLRYRPEGALGD